MITGGEVEDLYVITGIDAVKSLRLAGIVFKIVSFIPNGWKTTYMEEFCLSANWWTNIKQKQTDFRPSYGRCVAK